VSGSDSTRGIAKVLRYLFNPPATGYELYRYFGMFAIGPRDPPTARLPFWTRSRGLDRRGCGASDGNVCFFADAKVLRYLLYSPQLCRYIAISQLSRLSQLWRPDTSGDHTPQPSARAIRETNQKGQVQHTQWIHRTCDVTNHPILVPQYSDQMNIFVTKE
jgi:hypothetical protein